MTDPLPLRVRALLAGNPEAGVWDAMFPLLTVDAHGYPHVCLLSRTELDTDGDEVLAVIAGPTTIANLERDRRATLIAIDHDAAYYCKLDLARAVRGPEGWLAAALTVHAVKRDTAGVELKPARFAPTRELAQRERWERSARLLALLRER